VITRCPRCGQPNAPNYVVCVACGATLPLQKTDLGTQLRGLWPLVRQAWNQGIQETLALVREWVLRRPAADGPVVAGPFAGQVMLVQMSPLGGASAPKQEPALILHVADEARTRSFQVMIVGTRSGAEPRYGDRVRAWGAWDAGTPALRAWRVDVVERGGQPADLTCRTKRPAPTAAIALGILLLTLTVCLVSVIAPAIRLP
jgi:hypothetical protein